MLCNPDRLSWTEGTGVRGNTAENFRRWCPLIAVLIAVLDEALKPPDRIHDMLGAAAGGIEELLRGTGTGHRANRKFDHAGQRATISRKSVEHGITQSAFRPVILNNDYRAGLARGCSQGANIHRLD